jgi:hypothetical protein
VVQGVLSGIAVCGLTVLAVYMMNRLWQRSLMEDAAPAMGAAAALGLVFEPLGYGPRVRAVGVWAGEPVVVTWSGGVFGSRTLLSHAGQRSVHRLISSEIEMRRLLGGEE